VVGVADELVQFDIAIVIEELVVPEQQHVTRAPYRPGVDPHEDMLRHAYADVYFDFYGDGISIFDANRIARNHHRERHLEYR
jgi:hypothetical protein